MIDVGLSYLKTAAMAALWPLHELLIDGKSRYFWVYCVTGVAMMLYAQHVNVAGRQASGRCLIAKCGGARARKTTTSS